MLYIQHIAYIYIHNSNVGRLCFQAKREHSAYCSVLRDLNIDVIELPSDELSPECPFVNDLAVVTNGTAFICKPASRQRLKEVEDSSAI